MKRSVIFVIFILLSLTFVLAQNETGTDSIEQVNNAYACLENKVSGECSSLAIEEKIFTVMATGECINELIGESLSGGECWPASGCKIKTTGQAILALDRTTKDTKGAEDWLLLEITSPSDVEWYLQIESREETSCTVKYDGSEHNTILKEDKTFTSNAGPCLRTSDNDYWLQVSPGCYDKEFEISCDRDFQSNLLFKLKTSSILHVSERITSSSANGRTTEAIKSDCFKEGGKCTYEGSLWAALALKQKGYDISSFMPYLTTMAEKNPKLLPEAFLYALTAQDDYRTTLLLRQKAGKYWDEMGDKFYDTSVALLPITEEPSEKTNTKSWLLEIQDSSGCWQGNIRNTAFILASIWPRTISESVKSCTSSGNYCMAEVSCEGSTLDGYSCPIATKCCDTPKTIQACEDQTGEICSSGMVCTGTSTSASDTQIGETCCLGGTCEEPPTESECESFGGRCRVDCTGGETEEFYECDFQGDVCCMPGESSSLWWLWVLIILIILTVVGIIFRNKLRGFFSRSSGAKPGPQGRPGPPMGRRPVQRRILPPSQLGRRPPARRAPPKK